MNLRNILLISNFTLKEALSKKVILIFAGLATLFLFIIALLLLTTDAASLAGSFNMQTRIDGELVNVKEKLAQVLQSVLTAPLFGIGLFLSIFAVSGFIPALIEKGNIDLFLSKPVSRTDLILGKFTGGTIMIFLNITYLVVGLWVMLGLILGIWNFGFLYVIPVITFTFMVLYGVIILTGILTGSSILAMMLSAIIFVILSPILSARAEYAVIIGDTWSTVTDIFYYLIPQTNEMGNIALKLASGMEVASYQPLLVNTGLLFLTMSLAIIIFNKKDY